MTDWERKRYEDAKLAYYALMMFYPMTVEDLPGEEWKSIPCLDGYQVSTFGRVKSFKMGKVKILKPMVNRQGYLQFHLSKSSKAKWFRVNRLVAICFIPNPLGLPQVDHINGVKFNNHVSNLRWVTNSENRKQAFTTGLQKAQRGEERYNAKLTNEQAKFICDNHDKFTRAQLAKMFGVSCQLISAIQLGKKYKVAGGKIRKKRGVCFEDRNKIRVEYKAGGTSLCLLAKKYGVDQKTIWNIVHEK